MTDRKGSRWTLLWGLRGRRTGVRDAFALAWGQFRDVESVSAAKAARRALGPDQDRRWGWLMRRRARRLLVVAMVPVGALAIASGLTGVSLVPGFVLTAGAYFLVRQASRLVTELPESFLDERQVEIRNASFTIAYKILAGVLAVVVAGTVGWIYGVEAGRDFSMPDLSADLRLAVLWVFLGAMQSLPALVLLWREPDLDEPRPGAVGLA